MINHVEIEGVANNVAPVLDVMGKIVLNSRQHTKKTILKEIQEELDLYMNALKIYGFKVDKLKSASGKLLWDLGFRMHGEMGHGHLWLFPCWIYKYIPMDMILVNTKGDASLGPENFGKDVDGRTGCLSFGVILPYEKYEDVIKYMEELKSNQNQENTTDENVVIVV